MNACSPTKPSGKCACTFLANGKSRIKTGNRQEFHFYSFWRKFMEKVQEEQEEQEEEQSSTIFSKIIWIKVYYLIWEE